MASLWASLSTDLLYLGSDDEERYAAQAHELLLRNLINESAGPPLGYPVWESGPVAVTLAFF